MVALLIDNLWVEEVNQIKNEVNKHFSKHFLEEGDVRPRLDGVQFWSISDSDRRNIVGIFSREEVEEVIHSFDGNKSPGPDEYNFKFIQSFWGLIKDEVWGMVNDFFITGKLPKGFSPYFVALIPKIKNPQSLNEYRSISLLGCLYKIISKLLADRLKKVLLEVISCNQSAFLANINILDGMVVINEVVDYVKKIKEKELYPENRL